jgi:hypothetical protein
MASPEARHRGAACCACRALEPVKCFVVGAAPSRQRLPPLRRRLLRSLAERVYSSRSSSSLGRWCWWGCVSRSRSSKGVGGVRGIPRIVRRGSCCVASGSRGTRRYSFPMYKEAGLIPAAHIGLYAGLVLLAVICWLIAVQWRKVAGFQLPPRGEASSQPRRTQVRRYLPPFGSGSGYLTIVPGKVQVDTGRGRPLAIQRRSPIIVVHARFRLTRREAFIVRGETSWCGLAPTAVGSRTIRDELQQAGFELDDRYTRFIRFPMSPSAYLRQGLAGSETAVGN